MVYKLIMLIITLFATQILSSCKKENNSLVDKESFVNITAELMIIEKLNMKPEQKVLLAKQVFDKYKVNTDSYRRTKEYYQNDPAYWADVYKQVQSHIKDIIKKNKNVIKTSP